MTLWQNYHLPTTVDEALELLARYEGAARLVAGGTDLILEIQEGRRPAPEALVDVTRVREMQGIRREGDAVVIGGAATHAEIIANAWLRQHATTLVESCQVVGGPQVRNVATLGGNVAHALPAADGTVSLMTLEAEVQIATPAGREWVPIGEMFRGPGQSRIDSSRELLVAFRLKGLDQARRQASAFHRIMRPQGIALPILACSAAVALAEDGTIAWARICLGPVAPVPFRARQAETGLAGQPPTGDVLVRAGEVALSECRLRTSRHRATAEYRRLLLGSLLAKTLRTAVARAQGAPIILAQPDIGESGAWSWREVESLGRG